MRINIDIHKRASGIRTETFMNIPVALTCIINLKSFVGIYVGIEFVKNIIDYHMTRYLHFFTLYGRTKTEIVELELISNQLDTIQT